MAEAVRRNFRPGIRDRGSNYYTIKSGSATHVDAVVHGSTAYDVSIELQNTMLNAWCDCPFFSSEGPCKHLWATILKAGLGLKLEELGRLPVAEDREVVSLLAGNIRDNYYHGYGPPGQANSPMTYRLLSPLGWGEMETSRPVRRVRAVMMR